MSRACGPQDGLQSAREQATDLMGFRMAGLELVGFQDSRSRAFGCQDGRSKSCWVSGWQE